MAKNDKSNIYNTAMGKVGQSETEYNNFLTQNNARSDVLWDRATENYNPAFQGYSNYAAGGGLTQADTDRMRAAWGNVGAGGGGGGGWSAPQMGPSAYKDLSSAFANAYRPDYYESDTGFRKLSAPGGGFDAEQLQKLYGNVGRLTEIGETGGITDEDKANINRASILEQERTGGYSDQDKALVRAKSAASSPAYFAALKDNLERTRGQTGNLANAGAVNYKLARQGAQQQGQDRLAQEMALQESIRTGKERAGQFLSAQGLDLAGLRTANEIQGAREGGQLGLSTQEGITQNQLQGFKGLQESQTGLGQWGLGQAGGLDQFGLARAGGLDQMTMMQAQLDAQAAASSAASRAAYGYAASRDQAEFEQWLTTYGNEQKQYGIGGLESLYNTNLGAGETYTNMGLQGLNSKYGTQGQLLGLASQNRGNTAMENAGIIGGIAAPVLGNLVANRNNPRGSPAGGGAGPSGGGGFNYPGNLGGVGFYPGAGGGGSTDNPWGNPGGGYPGGGGNVGGPTTGGGQFSGGGFGHYDYALGRWVYP